MGVSAIIGKNENEENPAKNKIHEHQPYQRHLVRQLTDKRSKTIFK